MDNFLEFAFGGDPTHPESDADGLVRPEFRRVTASPDGEFVEVRFRRRLDFEAQGLLYEPQANANLADDGWDATSSEIAAPTEPGGDGLTEIVTLRIPTGPGTEIPGSRQFFRILVPRSSKAAPPSRSRASQIEY